MAGHSGSVAAVETSDLALEPEPNGLCGLRVVGFSQRDCGMSTACAPNAHPYGTTPAGSGPRAPKPGRALRCRVVVVGVVVARDADCV